MDVLRLTLRQLQIFVAVARSGSTTAASAEIALSQSATSSAVNELERLLSLRLFDRAGKRLLLNDNGRALLPRALALLDGAAGIEQMSRDGSAQAQSLRIGASTTIGNYVLPKLLAGFMGGTAARQRRRLAVEGRYREHRRHLRCRDRFRTRRGADRGAQPPAGAGGHPWLQDEMVVVAAPDSALAQSSRAGDRIPLRTLREAVWLVRETGSGTREATDQSLLPHLRSYRRSIELGSSEAIQRAAQEGLGVACLSAWVVNDALEAGRLCRVSTTLPRQLRQCHLVVHREKQSTPALLAFIAQADATTGAAR
ncbi:LysR substrate-binding domain-containing protein [Ottowia sp.]|uniref:LysR substrate-binding domain-containing protein n=1 Tax=Ottowia sp. TaxID=1898956 RepID=UPI0025CB82D3|nr:LysR substrate-binding domain-containing protein [Ottowia sp.]